MFKPWSLCFLSDKPFIKLTPVLSSEYKANKTDVEVMQGDIVKLAVEIEAYPEVEWTFWKTPLEKSNHTLEETFHRIHKRLNTLLVHLFLCLGYLSLDWFWIMGLLKCLYYAILKVSNFVQEVSYNRFACICSPSSSNRLL